MFALIDQYRQKRWLQIIVRFGNFPYPDAKGIAPTYSGCLMKLLSQMRWLHNQNTYEWKSPMHH